MAHTKAKGTTKLGRDSQSQRLGVKIYGGSPIKCGQIIIRQRGTAYMAGDGVKTGKDDTLYAVKDGVVNFKKIRYTNFTSNKKTKQMVSVVEKPEIRNQKSEKNPKTEIKSEKEEVYVEELKAETKEAMSNKSKSEYIKEEQPLKNIPQKKETKK